MQTFTNPSILVRHPRRRLTFALNLVLFALSSGVGGALVGAMVGIANYFSGPSYSTGAGGTLIANSLEQVVWFDAVANGIFMALLGVFVGVLLFAFIGTRALRQWSARHKVRYAQGLKARLFLPLFLTLIASGFLAGLCWLLLQGGFSAKISGELGSTIEFSSTAALPLGAYFWAWRLACFAKRPIRTTLTSSGRLLPLD